MKNKNAFVWACYEIKFSFVLTCIKTIIITLVSDTGSGRLEFNEFRDFYKEYKTKHKNNRQAIENAFKLFDKNGNGFIEAAELKAILSKCGQQISDEEIQEMIDVADADKDGKINYKGNQVVYY